jgi:hypothetical protein
MFSYSCTYLGKFLFLCWIKKLCWALQVVDIADILVTEKIKYRQFALCLHLTAIDLHCYLTCSMCITSKQSPVFKKENREKKETWNKNCRGAFF